MDRCSKCLAPDVFFVKYSDLKETWSLCHICNAAFDNKLDLLKEFMKDDFGLFPIHKISRNMITARMKRSAGKGAWTHSNGKDDDPSS